MRAERFRAIRLWRGRASTELASRLSSEASVGQTLIGQRGRVSQSTPDGSPA
jgi:hypothetical protein